MIEFGRFRFGLGKKAGSGSVADHYAVVAKVTGRKLQEPELPAALIYLWNIFASLDSARGGSGFGPNPIAWSEMRAYSELTGVRLSRWEWEAIRLLDEEYMAAALA